MIKFAIHETTVGPRCFGVEILTDDEIRKGIEELQDELSDRSMRRAKEAGVSIDEMEDGEATFNTPFGKLTFVHDSELGRHAYLGNVSLGEDLEHKDEYLMGVDVCQVLDEFPAQGTMLREAITFMEKWHDALELAAVKQVQGE